MEWALRTIGVLSLVGAGIMFGLCIVQWLGTAQEPEQMHSPSAVDRFIGSTGSQGGLAGVETSPLVRQAEVFALYLTPVSVPEERPQVAARPALAFTPPVSPPSPSPVFRLCGTSYCQSQPQESMALVSMRRSEEHTSELQSRLHLVCRLL